jgi:hypothetical protein
MKPGTVAQPEGDLRSVEGWKPHDFITEFIGGGTVMASGIFMCAAPSCSGMHRNIAHCMAGLVNRGLNNATENAHFHPYLTPIEQRSVSYTARGEQVDFVHSDNTLLVICA